MPFIGKKAFEWVKIVNPNDDSQAIAVPRLTGFAAGDAKTDNQETVYIFNNKSDSVREFKLVRVKHRQRKDEDQADDDEQFVRVESLGRFATGDAKTDNYETIWVLNQDLETFKDKIQFKRQRYYIDPANKDDSGAWVELIRPLRLAVADAKTDNVETILLLEWNDDDEPASEDFPKDVDSLPDALNDTASDPEQRGVRLDPIQFVGNVQWSAGDFVLSGYSYTSSTLHPTSFILTSKDGFSWSSQPIPSEADLVIQSMVYGSGRWLILRNSGGDIWSSEDKMKTWKKIATISSLFIRRSTIGTVSVPAPFMTFGQPIDVKNNPDPNAVKNGIFVVGGIDTSNFRATLFLSVDKGVTWSQKDIDGGGDGSVIKSVNFINRRFVVVIEDFVKPDPNGFGTTRSSLRNVISTDGATWTSTSMFEDVSGLIIPGSAATAGDSGYIAGSANSGVAYDRKSKKYGYAGWFISPATTGGGDSAWLGSSSDGASWQKTVGPLGDWQTINTAQGGITSYFFGQPAMGGERFVTTYAKFTSAVAPSQNASGEWGVITDFSGARVRLKVGNPSGIFTVDLGLPSACGFISRGADKDKGYVGTFVVIEQYSAFVGHGEYFNIWWSKDGVIFEDTHGSPFLPLPGQHAIVSGLTIGPAPKPTT